MLILIPKHRILFNNLLRLSQLCINPWQLINRSRNSQTRNMSRQQLIIHRMR
ncbi:hypothetical protein HanRHA438_Chr06g0274501 [Helianthus annuus]|nr:hypothetical protein HanRHA438_Chr06g0274501 [Helianthus annuus]